MKTIRTINLILSAGEEQSYNASGNNYYVFAATGPLTIAVNNGGSPVPHEAKTGVSDMDDFERISIKDTSGATNTVVLLVGAGNPNYVDKR